LLSENMSGSLGEVSTKFLLLSRIARGREIL